MRVTKPERIPNGSKLDTASSFPNQSPETNKSGTNELTPFLLISK
jgi:hypothetical protein